LRALPPCAEEYDLELEKQLKVSKLKAREEESQKNARYLSFEIIERHLTNGQVQREKGETS
jgi:hypothetical protein